VRLELPASGKLAGEGEWLTAEQWPALGLPAPVRKLLQKPEASN
jgi:A/G-specific adenine glycosylase